MTTTEPTQGIVSALAECMESLSMTDGDRGGPVQIRLLGGVSASTNDGEPVDLGPAKCQLLLASLAFSPGVAVPVDRLVDLIWGHDPPRTAAKTLQTYVGRLRRGLGSDRLVRAGAAYRLDVDRGDIDVLRFQDLVAAGDTSAALDEWTGDPLAGLDAPGLVPLVNALTEQWLAATELELERAVEREPASTVASLTELADRHPFRERVWALLMLALYRSGRQADALDAYSRARSHLVDELGVEPGPQLKEMEALVLGHDERLVQPAPAAASMPTGTVTFAFCDIEGSAELWARHRSRMSAVSTRHKAMVGELAEAHGGHLFSARGEMFGLAFGRASQALGWATALRDGVGKIEPFAGYEIAVRIGLNTGESDDQDGDYFGPAVDLAAQLCAAANPGQIVVSDVAASLLAGTDLSPLGEHQLDSASSMVRLHQVGEHAHPSLRTEPRRVGNLPRRMVGLHGRDADLASVADALDQSTLVTLIGPGGIGKTQVALEAARVAGVGAPGGAWIVELADIADPADVPRAVATALDIEHRKDRSILDSIIAGLADQEALLVLDNCEHIVDGAAALVSAISAECPRVAVLATSREGLAVAGERVVVVGPLDPAGAAVDLFAERAVAVDPAFDIDNEREVVRDICARLDGVPLAIELAAARLRGLSAGDLSALLDDRLRLLTGGRRRSVERHRTLRATIQWSYDLLAPVEQHVFDQLSTFAGAFDLDAAAAVASGDSASDPDGRLVRVVIGDLVDRSMVTVESGRFGRRYRLFESMRQYGAERLAERGESELLATRHGQWVTEEVERIGALLMSVNEIEGAARVRELWPNIRAAVDWGVTSRDRDLVTAVIRPIVLEVFVRRSAGEIADWVEQLLSITPNEDEEAIAEGLLWAGLHYSMTQQRERFARLIEECGSPDHLFVRYASLMAIEDEHYGALEVGPEMVAEMQRRGNDVYARLFQVFVGGALLSSGRFEESEKLLSGLAEVFRREGPPSFLHWALFLLGAGAAFRGDHELADERWGEITTIALPPRSNSPTETLLARAAFRQGQHRRAFGILRRYIDDLDDADNMAGVAMVCIEYVNMLVTLGRLDEAAVIVGHLDATGLLGVEQPGFKTLVQGSVDVVAADPTAAQIRRDAAGRMRDESAALGEMRSVLDQLLVRSGSLPSGE